jgi:hypothetical protein
MLCAARRMAKSNAIQQTPPKQSSAGNTPTLTAALALFEFPFS